MTFVFLQKGITPDITTQIINRDLERISLGATKWKVNFNPSKTEDMIFSNKVFVDIPNVNFNQTIVKQVLEHKHLGIWLMPSLCFSKQVHDVCLRANAKLAVLRSVSYLSRSTLDILYKIQIRSVIDGY